MKAVDKNNIIVMFGQHEWNFLCKSGFMTRNGQLLKYLNRSTYVNKIIYINPYFYSTSLFSILKNIIFNIKSSLFSVIVDVKRPCNYPKIVVLNILNLKKNGLLEKIFYGILKHRIVKEIRSESKNVIVWLYNPGEYDIFDLFPNARKVFDTVDNWLELDLDTKKHRWYNKTKIKEGYTYICEKDVNIISNGDMMTNFYKSIIKNRNCNNIITITNGVNTELFSGEKVKTDKLPQDLKRCKHPIIGYVGVIQERFDKDLLIYLLENNPDMSFVIVGPFRPFRNFKFDISYKNLYLLGPKPYLEIPKYIYNFDVCIIPHKNDEMTKHMSPMKIYEYLAMGKPVVSAPIEGVKEAGELIYVANSYEKFSQAIKKALNENRDELALARQKYAYKNSWESKINQFIKMIDNENNGN